MVWSERGHRQQSLDLVARDGPIGEPFGVASLLNGVGEIHPLKLVIPTTGIRP
jgi:hypothetical protein